MEAVPANMKKENYYYFGINENIDYREYRSRELIVLFLKPKRVTVPLWMSFREVLRSIKEATDIILLRTAKLFWNYCVKDSVSLVPTYVQPTQMPVLWI